MFEGNNRKRKIIMSVSFSITDKWSSLGIAFGTSKSLNADPEERFEILKVKMIRELIIFKLYDTNENNSNIIRNYFY